MSSPINQNPKSWVPEFDEGRHGRAKLGFILLSIDLAVEDDLYNMKPEGVGVHVTRIKADDVTTNKTLSDHQSQLAEAAAKIQPDVKPNVVCYACTSGSIVIGEDNVFEEIKKGAPWAEPMCIATAVVDALKVVGAKNITVGTPYIDEINELEKQFLENKGFNILNFQGLNLKTGVEFGTVTPEYWIKFAKEIDHNDADAMFLSCSGIRTVEVISEIEQIIQKPVITSNQAQFWKCLRMADVNDKIQGFGKLFEY